MAIKPGDLDSAVPPSSGADRMKARRRIMPWQAPDAQATASPSDQSPAIPDETPAPVLSAPEAAPLNASAPLSKDLRKAGFNENLDQRESADTKPTQSRHNSADKTQHKADTKIGVHSFSQVLRSLAKADTEPTQDGATGENDELQAIESQHNADTITVDTAAIENLESRHNADTLKEPVAAVEISKADTEPTHGLNRASNADTEPTQQVQKSSESRHNANTKPTPEPTHNYVAQPLSADTTLAQIPELERQYNLLRGLKLQLMNFCAHQCVQTNAPAFRTTYESLAFGAGIPAGSVRTTAKRLRDTGLIGITTQTLGPGAFVDISLPEQVLKIFVRLNAFRPSNADTNSSARNIESRHNADTRTDTNASSKLVSNLNTNYLGEEAGGDGFDSIDLSRLQRFGISKKHLQDIKNQKLQVSLSQLEDFVERFAIYSADPDNVRGVKSFAGLFIKMVQTLSAGTDPLPDVETAEAQHIRLALERRMRKKHELENLEKELCEFEFEDWVQMLTAQDRDRISPPHPQSAPAGSPAQKRMLKAHFLEHLWPERRAKAISSVQSLHPNPEL